MSRKNHAALSGKERDDASPFTISSEVCIGIYEKNLSDFEEACILCKPYGLFDFPILYSVFYVIGNAGDTHEQSRPIAVS